MTDGEHDFMELPRWLGWVCSARWVMVGIGLFMLLAVFTATLAHANCVQWGTSVNTGLRVCMMDDLVNRNPVVPVPADNMPQYSGSIAIHPSSCALATIAAADKAVTIDWACVGQFAKRYREGQGRDYDDTIAHVLQAIKDGEAKAQ